MTERRDDKQRAASVFRERRETSSDELPNRLGTRRAPAPSPAVAATAASSSAKNGLPLDAS
jgi:hypothetical protein